MMEKETEFIKRLITPKSSIEEAYDNGYDCGLNGANTTNCYFGLFSSPEKTKAWERGKRDALIVKMQKPNTND